jgi:hypothetical protein
VLTPTLRTAGAGRRRRSDPANGEGREKAQTGECRETGQGDTETREEVEERKNDHVKLQSVASRVNIEPARLIIVLLVMVCYCNEPVWLVILTS